MKYVDYWADIPMIYMRAYLFIITLCCYTYFVVLYCCLETSVTRFSVGDQFGAIDSQFTLVAAAILDSAIILLEDRFIKFRMFSCSATSMLVSQDNHPDTCTRVFFLWRLHTVGEHHR